MVLTGNLPTALAALALGTALLGLFVLSLRLFRAHGPQPAQPLPSPVANARARTLFGLNGDQPSLSVVLRQTQPADRLLGLLAGEGQASLHIGDRRIEATSHRLPLPASGPTRYVVVPRETERAAELPESGDEGAVVRVLAEIKRALSTSLDLDETRYVILAGLAGPSTSTWPS